MVLDLLRQGKCVSVKAGVLFISVPADKCLTTMRPHADFNSFICFQPLIQQFTVFNSLLSGHHFHHRFGDVWRRERRETLQKS